MKSIHARMYEANRKKRQRRLALLRPYVEEPNEELKAFLFSDDRKEMEQNKDGFYRLWRLRRKLATEAGDEAGEGLNHHPKPILIMPSHPTFVYRATDAKVTARPPHHHHIELLSNGGRWHVIALGRRVVFKNMHGTANMCELNKM